MEMDKEFNPISAKPAGATIAMLRSYAAQAERNGKLTPEQLQLIYDNKWFKLFVPKRFGGLELSVPEGVRIEEELARIDGSLGWTVTLCAGANLFVGYVEPTIAPGVFSDPRVCLGGSGQPSGTAAVTDDGYQVTGRWRYATGAPHNTHFTANCTIEQNGKPVLDEQGQPLVKSFFFDREDVRILADWNTFGLRATASHSFEVNSVRVDRSRAFIIAPEQARLDIPLYRYPFLPFAQTTLAANTLGMARHFMACCEALVAQREQRGNADSNFRKLLNDASRQVEAAKHVFYDALDTSWELHVNEGQLSDALLQRIGETSRTLVSRSQEAVVSLYPHCGITGADASSTINRIWRDMFTASQHSLLR